MQQLFNVRRFYTDVMLMRLLDFCQANGIEVYSYLPWVRLTSPFVRTLSAYLAVTISQSASPVYVHLLFVTSGLHE